MFLLLNLRRKHFEFLLSLFLFRATNPSFKEVLSRIESHEDCRNLPMISFLILPMQRVTRLPLLMDVRHDLMSLPLWVAVLLSIWLRKLFLFHLNQCTIALLQIPPTKCKCWKVSLCLISLEITFNLGLCGRSEVFRLHHSLNVFEMGKISAFWRQGAWILFPAEPLGMWAWASHLTSSLFSDWSPRSLPWRVPRGGGASAVCGDETHLSTRKGGSVVEPLP